MNVLLCGSRDWKKSLPIRMLLDGLYDTHGTELVVIHGAARGADEIAARWYAVRGTVPGWAWGKPEILAFPADWDAYGPQERWRCGRDRNQRMLDEGNPEVVFAFKNRFGLTLGANGKPKGGTEHMCSIAVSAGVPTFVTSEFTGF